MNTKTIPNTHTAHGATITRDEATEYGPRWRWAATAIDGTIVYVTRNGDDWQVGTYRANTAGRHHRTVQFAIPDVDRTQAFDLACQIVAAIADDPTYEAKRRA